MSPARTWWALAAIVLLALAVRAWDLGGPSLWNDELFSRYYPRLGLRYLWGAGWTEEPNPPLYYTLLAGWMGLFGPSAAAMRSLGVLISVAEIPLAFLLGRLLFGDARAGLLAALALALSPTTVWYAQEARSYVVEGFGTLLALLGVAMALRAPGRWRGAVLYGIGALLAAYGHVTAVLFLVAVNAAVAAWALVERRLPGLWRWGLANLAVAVCCLPLIAVALSPAVSRAIGWMEPPAWIDLPATLGITAFGPVVSDHALPAGVVAVAGLAALIGWRWRAGRLAVAIASVPVVFFALLTLVSLRQPMLMGRTMAWTAIPLAVVLGGVLARCGGAVRGAVLGVLCVALVLQAANARRMKEDWRGFLQTLAPRLEVTPAPLVALAPWMPATAMKAYAPGVGPLHGLPIEGSGSVEWTAMPAMLGVQPLSWAALAEAVRSGRPVWVIGRGEEGRWLDAHLADLPPPKEQVREGPGFGLRW